MRHPDVPYHELKKVAWYEFRAADPDEEWVFFHCTCGGWLSANRPESDLAEFGGADAAHFRSHLDYYRLGSR